MEIIAADDRVAAQIEVRQGPETFRCAGFYTVRASRILEGIEHWVTERSDTPPEWRKKYVSP